MHRYFYQDGPSWQFVLFPKIETKSTVIFTMMGYPGEKMVTEDLPPGCPSENTGLHSIVFLLGQGYPGKNNHIFLVSAVGAFSFARTPLSLWKKTHLDSYY